MISLSLSLGLFLCAASCPEGQSINADTAGQCCWSGQVYSKLQKRCVGVPACPVGMEAQGETCAVACPAGQSVNADTAGHCCWGGQVWSNARNVCVGIPQCPPGMGVSGEACVAMNPNVPPPPPQYPPQPQYPPPTQQYAQPQYQQPAPQYAQPQRPPDAPTADPSLTDVSAERAKLNAKLTDLRASHAKVSVGVPIALLAIGLPAFPLGIWMMVTGFETDQLRLGVLGILTAALGGSFALIGAIEIPGSISRKSRLSKEIRATEEELRALDRPRARLLFDQQRPAAPVFALSSPVFTF
ncbi:MAG TPA: hypothetical protein VGD87_02180 [Archangium sp.]